MPTVPQKQIGEVRNVPAPTVFQSAKGIETLAAQAGTGLQAFGQGLQNVGNSLEKVTTRIAIEDNERMAKELDVEYNKRRRAILYGDEKVPGYYSLQGSAAVDNSERVKEELSKARDEISSTAKNNYVKRIFDKASLSKHDSDLDHMGAFVNKERTVANLTASQARRKEAIDDAVLAPNSPQVVNRSVAIINNEIDAEAKIKGWQPDVIKTEREKALTLMYSEMIKGALHRQDVEGAVALFKEHSGKMDAPVAAQIEELLKKPKLIASAQKETDTRFAQATSNNRNDIILRTETDLKAQPELRDEVVKRLKEKFALKDELDKDNRKAIVGNWAKAIGSGERTLDQLIIQNPDEYAVIAQDYYSLAALTNAQVLRDKRQNHPAVSDKPTLDMFSKMEDNDLIKTDLTAFRATLSEADFKRVEARRRIALDKQKGREETSLHMNRFKSVMKEYNQEHFKFFNPKQSDAQKEIQRKIIQEGELFIQEKIDQGKAPTDIELRQLMETLIKPVSSGGLIESGLNKLFGDAGTPSFLKTTLAEAKAKYNKDELERIRIDINDLPDKLKTDISNRFKAAGITPTDGLVEEYAGAVFTKNESRKERLLQNKVKTQLSEVINTVKTPKFIPQTKSENEINSTGEPNIIGEPKDITGTETSLVTKATEENKAVEKLGTTDEAMDFPEDKRITGKVSDVFKAETATVDFKAPEIITPTDKIKGVVSNVFEKEQKELEFTEPKKIEEEEEEQNSPSLKSQSVTNKILDIKRQVESGGNAFAVSNKGAIGPYQIMPETARNPGFGIKPITVADLTDEVKSREFAEKYLNALLQKYKGDMIKTLAAWNYGPGNVDKLIKKYGDEAYLAALPQETRNHILKIRNEFVKK